MINEFIKYFKFILGLFIAATGTVFTIKSNLGLSPWDVLHEGLSLIMPVTIGQGNIIVSVVVIILAVLMKAVVGSGSIIATFIFGIFMDFIIYLDFIPEPNFFIGKIILIVVGVFIFAYGTYISISIGLGCGPRDSLMIALSKKTGFSIGNIRNFLEFLALILGYTLGGSAGVGTVMIAIFTGLFLQLILSYYKFDPNKVEQRNLKSEIRYLIKKIKIKPSRIWIINLSLDKL